MKHRFATVLVATAWVASAAHAQLRFEAFDLEHPAIGYRSTPASDPVATLNGQLSRGERQLTFGGLTGYLRALLTALDVPVESQIVAYSRTSLQGARIRPDNPRAIYFSDSVVVAWVRGGFIEVAAHDPRQGGIFYVLPQTFVPSPQLLRDERCLGCHYSAAAEGVPGFFVRSIPTAADGSTLPWLGNVVPDHRTPLDERWGGWYVTGRTGSGSHLGNLLIPDRRAGELPGGARPSLSTLAGRFPTDDYLSPHSDVVALLVFEHQARMMNLITRIGWEVRAGADVRALAREVVDYMLFIDEAPLADVRGSSSFAEVFAARGPRDRAGRSLRDLDLQSRLLRYPCSYMIYSEAFDALPADARELVYRRLKAVLSGEVSDPKYARLSADDREAILQILRDTKSGLPDWF